MNSAIVRARVGEGVMLPLDVEGRDVSRVVERRTRCSVERDCVRIMRQGFSDWVARVRKGGFQ